eukprot:426135_1
MKSVRNASGNISLYMLEVVRMQNTRFFSSFQQSRNIDNFRATQLIKNLYLKNDKHSHLDSNHSSNTIQHALDIFRNINEPKNSYSINTLLTLFLQYKCTENINVIWNDVVETLSRSPGQENLSSCYHMLVLCCGESLNINKCIDVLRMMEQDGHTLTAHHAHIHIATLLNKANPTIKQLKYIESLLTKRVLRSNEYILRALIHAYGRHKDVPSAIHAFHFYMHNTTKKNKLIPIRKTLLTLMLHNGYYKELLELYHTMHQSKPIDPAMHCLALKACVRLRDYTTGHGICNQLCTSNNSKEDIKMKTRFIDFYGIFGNVKHALHIFESIAESETDIVCIGAMLKAFVNNGFYRQAIELYDKMDDRIDRFPNASKDAACHVLTVKACANLKDLVKGEDIYHQLVSNNKNELQNLHLVTAFIDFYGQCNQIQKAIDLFDKHQSNSNLQNIVCINCMLSAYIDNGCYKEALSLYDTIADLDKTDTTHVLGITACSKSGQFNKGQSIYKQVKGKNNIQIKTSLIDLFGNCKDVDTMWKLFNSIQNTQINIIAINAMMTALINNDCNKDALHIYETVSRHKHIQRDGTTYTMAIKACGNTENVAYGEQIYADAAAVSSVMKNNIQIQTALIQFYGQCHEMEKALNVFNNIPHSEKNIVTINSMLTAFINNGYDGKALELYREIDCNHVYAHISKDSVLYSVAIKACTNSNNFDFGQKIHDEIRLKKADTNDTQLHLINMYSKCGMVHVCEDIFEEVNRSGDKMYFEDINIWNEMINAHLRNNGDMDKAKALLKRMQNETNLCANYKTYSLLLNGCSHRGDMEEADRIWKDEIKDHATKYEAYIIGTLVDCCSRKGCVYQGFEWIYKYEKVHNKQANQDHDYAMWMSLLHGTRQTNNGLLAQYIYNQIIKRFSHDATRIKSASVQIANIANSSFK